SWARCERAKVVGKPRSPAASRRSSLASRAARMRSAPSAASAITALSLAASEPEFQEEVDEHTIGWRLHDQHPPEQAALLQAKLKVQPLVHVVPCHELAQQLRLRRCEAHVDPALHPTALVGLVAERMFGFS